MSIKLQKQNKAIDDIVINLKKNKKQGYIRVNHSDSMYNSLDVSEHIKL